MLKRLHKSNQKGFTLIELLSVMIIMGVMASVGAKKFELLSDTASDRVIDEGLKELNIREALTWTNIKLSSDGWINDADVFTQLDTNLGADFVWATGPNASGGDLHLRSQSIILNRIASTSSSAGRWK
jgi:prepilin-type N-terminal cleavage/methylation domain-containing protein